MLIVHRSLSSGYPFPLPMHIIPANFYILLRLALVCFILSPRFRHIAAVRKEQVCLDQFRVFNPISKGTHYLVPDLPELSLPLAAIPANVTPCGPIIPLPTPDSKIEESGRQMLRWMGGGETIKVLISFGSHLAPSTAYCVSLARGLRRALDQYPRLLVVWKRKLPREDDLVRVTDALGDAWTEGRVNMVEWLTVCPAHLLMLPGVVAHVHHGGANSFFGTCR
jgi:hypothetical protein